MDASNRGAVSQSEDSRKHALECLRLAEDCRRLARDIGNPAGRRHFLRMAEEWTALAEQGPEAEARNPTIIH